MYDIKLCNAFIYRAYSSRYIAHNVWLIKNRGKRKERMWRSPGGTNDIHNSLQIFAMLSSATYICFLVGILAECAKNAKSLFSQLTTASHHYKTSFDMAIVEIHAVVR